MPKRKRLTLIDKIKNILAIQGIIFIALKIIQYIQDIPIVQRWGLRMIAKGWLSQWGFEWLV